MTEAQPLPFDYNNGLFRHGTETHALDCSTLLPEHRDVHPLITDRLFVARPGLVLDMGCGPTKLGPLLDAHGVPWVGIDAAIRRLALGVGPRILGDAKRLPFRDGAFGAVAALYMLYHFAAPLVPIREAFRVLKPGGLFCACAPSRFDDPELADVLPPTAPETFDSDTAPEMIGSVFEIVRIDRWDMPIYRFPDPEALATHLLGVSLVREPEEAHEVAAALRYPFWLTKRGATVWGRKRKEA